VQAEAVGQGHLGVGRFEGLELLGPVVGLFGPRLAVERGGLDLAQELREGERPLADRRLRRLVGLFGQAHDQVHQGRVPGLPGAAHVL
jgi:hypothetical protein